jgi:S-adenosylmethionine:tRNA ribosyltransferase-isomerase
VKLTDFEFSLPAELIAQHPLPRRDESRMMVVWRESGQWEHRFFHELPEVLSPEHFLVLNNTRVFAARLWGHRPGKRERIEILLVRERAPGQWAALLKPAHKAPTGQLLEIADFKAEVIQVLESGQRLLQFGSPEPLLEDLDRIGEPPLPPYVRRASEDSLETDLERYQTVYARHKGSIAAPTAGLHFTREILSRLEQGRIHRCEILLHVGYGTFQPVRTAEIENHVLEPEYYEVPEDTASCINEWKEAGKQLVAVGTTTTRALEYQAGQSPHGIFPGSGWCDLFIYPGFTFQIVDGLLTNFHLPASTLLMLVCALAGREFVLECYREAVARRYRFFSYGDCMLIL